jgi:hypothetical protein
MRGCMVLYGHWIMGDERDVGSERWIIKSDVGSEQVITGHAALVKKRQVGVWGKRGIGGVIGVCGMAGVG